MATTLTPDRNRHDNSPIVSVVMAVYNGERFLAEAVESILNQTFTDFEFIIINDGSTDSTPQILSGYAARDDRIILIHNQITFLTWLLLFSRDIKTILELHT